MINSILKGIFTFVGNLTNIILNPIWVGINTILGSSASDFLTPISNLFDYLEQFAPLAVSYLGLSSEVLSTLILLVIANITIPISVHVFKLALRWYNTLKI